MEAVEGGHFEMARLLLRHGADTDCTDKASRSLHIHLLKRCSTIIVY